MLTDEQRLDFYHSGVSRLPRAGPRSDADEMPQIVWSCLRNKYRIERDAPATWPQAMVEQIAGAHRFMGTRHLPKSTTFAQVGSPSVCAALDDLLGAGNWQPPEQWGSLLVAFPESQRSWGVPSANWHLDLPASHSPIGLDALRIFTCLAELPPGGGGTLFVTGFHRLVQNLVAEDERLSSPDTRKRLIRAHPWLKSLCAKDDTDDRIERFMRRGANINGFDVCVVEMIGQPGDVFLAHPMILHAPALNCSRLPRIVLSATASIM